jgi:hypothetical protein
MGVSTLSVVRLECPLHLSLLQLLLMALAINPAGKKEGCPAWTNLMVDGKPASKL